MTGAISLFLYRNVRKGYAGNAREIQISLSALCFNSLLFCIAMYAKE
jgi:hypothetical protein